jgi:hypothetical protein
MQCNPVTALPAGENWTFEIKFDGYHACRQARAGGHAILTPQESAQQALFQELWVSAARSRAISLSTENWSFLCRASVLAGFSWGAMFLTPEQLADAQNDVRHLHRLQQRLSMQLGEAKLARSSGWKRSCSRSSRAWKQADLPSMPTECAPCVTRLMPGRQACSPRSAPALTTTSSGSPMQILEAFNANSIGIIDSKEETLVGLDDPRAAKLLAWREHSKLSSMIATLLAAERGGRIHAQFNPMETVTGRFTSKGPNLQQVTRGPLRACFVPSGPDHRLIVADYSQVELRVAALVAERPS